jgi:hypothetical protein
LTHLALNVRDGHDAQIVLDGERLKEDVQVLLVARLGGLQLQRLAEALERRHHRHVPARRHQHPQPRRPLRAELAEQRQHLVLAPVRHLVQRVQHQQLRRPVSAELCAGAEGGG